MEQNHCSHLGFPIDMILAGFDPEVIFLLQRKLGLKVTKGLERDVENWFSRWWLWWLPWIFIPLSFSCFVSTRGPNAHHQVSIQLDYTGDVQNMNSQYFSHIWACRPSWSTDHDHFSNLLFPQLKEAPHEIWAKLAQWLQRRSRLKMLMDGRTDDGQKMITIAHPEHSSGELKIVTGDWTQSNLTM